MTNNFSQRFIARLATRTRKRRERRERARALLLKTTGRPSSAHKVTNSDTPAADHRKGTGPTARNPALHKTKVQYSPELEGLICGTITMPHIENKVATPIRPGVHANVPDASQARFIDVALAAKTNCPIARLLKTNNSMTATLDL